MPCTITNYLQLQTKPNTTDISTKHKKNTPRRQWSPLRWSSSPLSSLSWRQLDPIKLTYNTHRPDRWLKLTASTFNQIKPVCHQSWSQGLLLCITWHFFPNGGRNHHQYYIVATHAGMPRPSGADWSGRIPGLYTNRRRSQIPEFWLVTNPRTKPG